MASQLKKYLLHNSLDFLLSAAEYASRGESERSWRYAVLHLHAGIELLMKALLADRDETLVFQKRKKPSESQLKTGKGFESVSYAEARKMIEKGLGVRLGENTRRFLVDLNDIRRRTQHYREIVTSTSGRSILANGIHFCIDLINEHLKIDAGTEEAELYDSVFERSCEFSDFVRHRLGEIEPELSIANSILVCPICSQETLMIGAGDPTLIRLVAPRCPFCNYSESALDLAEDMAERDGLDGLEECPVCREETCFRREDDASYFCTSCGNWGHYDRCARCGRLSVEEGVCSECFPVD